MDLNEKIKEDLKSSMKAQDKTRTSVLRMILADIKIAETSGKPRDQIDYVAVVHGYQKKLKKTREEYERLSLSEKVREIDNEIAIVEEYLPKQLSDEDIKKIINEVVEENKFTAKEFGAAMKLIMTKCGGIADGKKVQTFLKQKLGC
ncbi:MAG: GatB/YqeY domain-containing protein [Candidatus Kuenenia sp.]|nr:GatB/YqeY domain-containing protein [Candidatus Kuenenia hertensis]